MTTLRKPHDTRLLVGCCAAPSTTILGFPASSFALDEPVQKGREALGSGWEYPWYDAAADDLRRVQAREAWDWNVNFSGYDFSWMQWLAWGLLITLLAVIAYLLILVYLRRESAAASSAGKGSEVEAIDDEARIAALPFKVDRRRRNLLDAAREHYEAGRYSQAIIYLFSHELVELDKRQLIRLAKGKTNRQYLREIERGAAVRGVLEQTMVAFEDVFFGNHPLDRQRFEACWNRLPEFDRETAQGAS